MYHFIDSFYCRKTSNEILVETICTEELDNFLAEHPIWLRRNQQTELFNGTRVRTTYDRLSSCCCILFVVVDADSVCVLADLNFFDCEVFLSIVIVDE